VTIWEIILLWALGASVAVTVAMVVVLAVIFWVSRKLDSMTALPVSGDA
jgi:hypothetical protein